MYTNNQCNKFQEAATVDGNGNLAQKVENYQMGVQPQNESHRQLIGVVVPQKEKDKVSFTDYQTDQFNKFFHYQMQKKSYESPLTLVSQPLLVEQQKKYSLNPIVEKISYQKNISNPDILNRDLRDRPKEIYIKEKKKIYNNESSIYEKKIYKNRNQIYLPKTNQNVLLEQVEIQEVPVYKRKYKPFQDNNNLKTKFVDPDLIREERIYNLDQLSNLNRKQEILDNTLNLDPNFIEIQNISKIQKRNDYYNNHTEQEIVNQLDKTIYDTKMVKKFKEQVKEQVSFDRKIKKGQIKNTSDDQPLVIDYSDIFPLIKDALFLIISQFTQFFKDVQSKKHRDKLTKKYVNAEEQQLIKIKFPFGVEINIARATYYFFRKLVFWYALYFVIKKLFTNN